MTSTSTTLWGTISTVLLGAVVLLSSVAVPVTANAQETTPAIPTEQAQGADGTSPVTFSVSPATDSGADDRISFRHELDPGGQITEYVEVVNHSDVPATFQLAASDGVVAANGDFDVLPSGTPAEDSGAWVDIQDQVSIEARSSAVVPFTLTVPEDAVPGDHPAGIVISLAATESVEDAVAFDARIGVRIHLRVAGEIIPSIIITDFTADYQNSWNPLEPGAVTLTWTLQNTGNVRLGATQYLDLLGPWSIGTGVTDQFVGEQREILPGGSVQGTTTVDAWPLFALNADISSPVNTVGDDSIEVELTEAQATTRATAIPWLYLVIVIPILSAAIILPLRARQRKKAHTAAIAKAREEGMQAARRGGGTDDTGAGDEGASLTASSVQP